MLSRLNRSINFNGSLAVIVINFYSRRGKMKKLRGSIYFQSKEVEPKKKQIKNYLI